jgi:type II secretory pathway pseudopilin PulG
MLSLKRRPLNSNGDTIVEVLIVIVVIASVLASAYAIAVRSLQDTQRTQEHSYALKIAEGQIENLKAAIQKDPAFLTSAVVDGSFCLSDTLQATAVAGGSPTADINSDSYSNYTANNPPCRKDPNDLINSACATYCYYYAIDPDNSIATPNTFAITVRWDGVGGVKNQVQLFYKVYR